MIVPTKTYYKVAVSLLVLFTLTVVIAYVDLGPWNIIVALIIATVKALFVVLYFMHVRYSSRVTWVFAIAGFFWLIILFTFTMSDYLTRS
ncbi:MAG TPA: cytochrome C oxidase subunit IV family protein [Bacteroidota bacterium]|jgi:cytochrome c oxidase subunit 4